MIKSKFMGECQTCGRLRKDIPANQVKSRGLATCLHCKTDDIVVDIQVEPKPTSQGGGFFHILKSVFGK